MKLVDAAKYTVETEPCDGNSVVHWLGTKVMVWKTRYGYGFNVVDHDVLAHTTEILDLDISRTGILLQGNRTVIGEGLVILESDRIAPESLEAYGDYILGFCLERIEL